MVTSKPFQTAVGLLFWEATKCRIVVGAGSEDWMDTHQENILRCPCEIYKQAETVSAVSHMGQRPDLESLVGYTQAGGDTGPFLSFL